MNANELADINEWSCCAHSKEVSAMLRQQQAEIEALKAENKALDERNYWIEEHHPVKELTEKEIVEVINEHGWRGLTGYLLTFAHAILRKAQDKC